jgi:DNA-binding HxlR family transcriptional regulator
MINDRLVLDCSHVLSTLLEGELHVNQIINKTGLYKDYVRAAIKELHVAKLISEKKHPKYAQRKMKMLTELGRELAKLKDGVDAFHRSLTVFEQTVKSVLDLSEKDPKAVQKILSREHWTNEEIGNCMEWIEQVRILTVYTLRLFSDALLARYTMIISRFDVNKRAKSILIKIVTDALSEHLSSRPTKRWTCALCGAVNQDSSRVLEELNPGVFDLIGDFDFTNKFASSEIKKLLFSSFLVMAPPEQYLEQRLKNEKEIIERMPNEPAIYLSKARAAFYEEILAG